jgi:hypothetical protein
VGRLEWGDWSGEAGVRRPEEITKNVYNNLEKT